MKNSDQNLELILLDKGPFQSLKDEELEMVSKHKLLVPEIFLIENLKRAETFNKLCELENTFRIDHWYVLAKENLLGQGITVTPEDIKTITDDPVKLKEQIKLAKEIAKECDEWCKKLTEQSDLDLSPMGCKNRVIDEVRNQVRTYLPENEITDDEISRMVGDTWRKTKNLLTVPHSDWKTISQSVINLLDNKPIEEEHRHLKESERTYICNAAWLNFACQYFQVTESEKSQIFNRWQEEFCQPLKYFASYTYYILALEFTISWYIRKSKGNYKREIKRDFEYLYYANCSNITFHTCDLKLKETIQKIPFLKHVQEKMVYFYNDEVKREGELNKSDWLKMLKNTEGVEYTETPESA